MKKYLVLILSLLSINSALEGCCGSSGSAGRAGDSNIGQNWKMISRQSFDATASTALTISRPGNYMLTETYTDSNSLAITAIISITADDVVLDLGGHSIIGQGGTGTGIAVASSAYNVVIQNGNVRETDTGPGISVGSGARDIVIQNIGINNTTASDCIDIAGGKNITLKNITLSCDSSSTGKGIDVSGAVQNLTIENFKISGLNNTGAAHGIHIASGSYGIILRCGKISNIGSMEISHDGINFAGACYDITIEDVSFANISGEGIDLNASYGVRMKNLNFANIRGGYAINVSGNGYDIGLENFHISNINTSTIGGGIGLSSGADGITIKNGSIIGVTTGTGYGISMIGNENVAIEDVVIANTISSPIYMGTTACKNVLIRNCTISNNNTTHGIDIAIASEDIVIENVKLGSIASNAINIPTACKGISLRNITATNASVGLSIQGAAKGIAVDNFTMHGVSTGIIISSAANGIVVNGLRITNASTTGISISSAAYGIRIKDFHISGVTNNGIAITGAPYDLRFEDFEIANTGLNGINFLGAGSYNVKIKNGIIANCGTSSSPIYVENSSYDFEIDNVSCSDSPLGIYFNGNADSTTISNVTVKNSSVSNIDDSNSYGIKFTHSEGIILENCRFSNVNNTTISNVAGVLFETCTNVKCTNVESGAHVGTGAQGFNLTGVNGAYLKNCRSQGNHATDSTSTYTCAGFFVTTSTAVIFEDCFSAAHHAPRQAAGFYLNWSNSCVFNNCVAAQNKIVNAVGKKNAHFSGFYSRTGYGNSWNECQAYGQFAGNTASTSGYGGAYGFYVSAETQASFYKCKARGNGSNTGHAATAAGFFLDNTVGSPARDSKYCQIRECEASANCTSGTSGTTAYGFRDGSTDTTNMILDCFAFGNTDNAATRVVTNYYMDLPIGGTTPSNWPRVEANMDGILDLANKPLYYNVSITN